MHRIRTAVCLLVLAPAAAIAQDRPPQAQVFSPYHQDVSPALRDIPPGLWRLGELEAEPVRPIPNSRRPFDGPDPVLQGSMPARPVASLAPVISINRDGLGGGFVGPQGSFAVQYAPPDNNGAVGATQFVEAVNVGLAVFDKATGTPVYGPVPINTLWTGFGTGCETNNDGDPTVSYDRIANRWVISQFSVNSLPYTQCVAVSTTSDATGSYYRYAFTYGNTAFNDYPKFGVWPDGYYVTYNIFNNGVSFAGAKVCALDRSGMIAGLTATQQCFNTTTAYGGLLPADLDGSTPPPAGAPNYLVALGATSTQLAVWKFHVDWTTPANSTFTGPTALTVAGYAEACGGGTCVPQSSTTNRLDSLADRLMNRAAYRNFGTHESLVVNHSVTAGTSVGVRWYELRSLFGTPALYQQGTFAPDAAYRWMGSIAQDKAGNIALGYSTSSSSLRPQIRYTGRLAGDATGTMTQGETTIVTGAGSQTGGLSRWGDYTSMQIDPVDDCTFWYTNQYIPVNGSFNWRTRIAAFRFPECSTTATPDFTLAATPASATVTAGNPASYTVTVTPVNGYTGSVTLSATGLPTGASASFSPNPTTGTSTMTVTTGGTTPAGASTITITGVDGSLAHSTTVQLTVQVPDFTLTAAPSSASVAQGGSTTYTATVTPSGGFAGTVALAVSGLPTGATGSFSPASLGSGNSTLTVATTASTPAGSYPLTITGTSGSIVHSATVTLVVTAVGGSGFTLSATPDSRTIGRSQATTYAVTVTRAPGFTGRVTFSVSLPSRVTAAFNPKHTTGNSSTLTVRTGALTTFGTYTLTITGTSAGVPTATTTVTLIVN
jgi:hypothetical protein